MDLLGVVDVLTRPSREHVAQPVGDGWRVATVEVPALLCLLRDAIGQQGERSLTGSASARDTRNPVDLDALREYELMRRTAAGWVRDVGVRASHDPVRDLRAWYAATLMVNRFDGAWYRNHLAGWVGRIRDHLEPPESFVIRSACPVCKVAAFGNVIDGGDLWPIQVRYRLVDGLMTDEVARCRAGCGTVWRGHGAVMELAEELADA